MTKKSFIEATKLIKVFNNIVNWNGYKIGTVMWHSNREWKLVDTDNFEVIKTDDYKPIAEFHTQAELWEYIKSIIV